MLRFLELWKALRVMVGEMDEESTTRNPYGLVDPVILGRRIRAARTMGGYPNADVASQVLADRFGIEMSGYALKAIERGEVMPKFDAVLAFVFLFEPDAGLQFFIPAMRPDYARSWNRVNGRSEE